MTIYKMSKRYEKHIMIINLHFFMKMIILKKD